MVYILAAFFVWVSILTVLVVRALGHYNRLTKGVSKAGLREVLTNLLHHQEDVGKHIQEIEASLERLRHDGTLHIQRIGIVRFNPFADTGGSQSFTLALLDGRNNGIVMTSLYARTGNRWYVKEVADGKGKELELSKEEQAAVKHAFRVV